MDFCETGEKTSYETIIFKIFTICVHLPANA